MSLRKIAEGNVPSPIIEAIKARRKELGISQQKLSEMTELRYASIANWETGQVAPMLPNVEKLVAALGGTLRVDWADTPNQPQ